MDNNETMIKVVGIRFKDVGKIYNFLPQDDTYSAGEAVIVETERGIECGEVVKPNITIDETKVVHPLKKIIRKCTEQDHVTLAENKERQKEAMRVCSEHIFDLKLDMKLVEVELTFDRNKMVFYFTSEGRVDFRELVKKLAVVYRTRIELRQIGVRDEAKMLNGIGMCGRPLCCSTFLGDFHPVSIKMAKEQNLSLNPTKISGICGRLMCCLKYEEEVYRDLGKNLPGQGDIVKTPTGEGEVMSTHLLMQQVKVIHRLKPNEPPIIEFFPVSEVELIRTKKKHRQQLMQNDKNDKNEKHEKHVKHDKNDKHVKHDKYEKSGKPKNHHSQAPKHEKHEKHEKNEKPHNHSQQKHQKHHNNQNNQNQAQGKNEKPHHQNKQGNPEKQGHQNNQGNQGKNQSHKPNKNQNKPHHQNKQGNQSNPNKHQNANADGVSKNEK